MNWQKTVSIVFLCSDVRNIKLEHDFEKYVYLFKRKEVKKFETKAILLLI